MRASAWLGVDVGTSSLKVVAVDASGFSLAEKETALPLERPTPQQAEADPRAWTRAVDDLLGPMSETYDVRAVGVTGQMHGTILVGESGAPVRPAVLWPDSRAEVMRHRWDTLPVDVLGRLGNPWSSGMNRVQPSSRQLPGSGVREARVTTLPRDYLPD